MIPADLISIRGPRVVLGILVTNSRRLLNSTSIAAAAVAAMVVSTYLKPHAYAWG